MNVRIEVEDSIMTAFIIGEIDHHSAKDIRETLDARIEGALPKLLILDYTDVSFMDSSGIGLIMGRYKLMKSIGGETRVTNPSPQIKRVMRLAGLDRLAVIDGSSNAKCANSSKGGNHYA